MCWVMPPASPATTFACRMRSSSVVLPWSTWPMTVMTGGRGSSSASSSSSSSSAVSIAISSISCSLPGSTISTSAPSASAISSIISSASDAVAVTISPASNRMRTRSAGVRFSFGAYSWIVLPRGTTISPSGTGASAGVSRCDAGSSSAWSRRRFLRRRCGGPPGRPRRQDHRDRRRDHRDRRRDHRDRDRARRRATAGTAAGTTAGPPPGRRHHRRHRCAGRRHRRHRRDRHRARRRVRATTGSAAAGRRDGSRSWTRRADRAAAAEPSRRRAAAGSACRCADVGRGGGAAAALRRRAAVGCSATARARRRRRRGGRPPPPGARAARARAEAGGVGRRPHDAVRRTDDGGLRFRARAARRPVPARGRRAPAAESDRARSGRVGATARASGRRGCRDGLGFGSGSGSRLSPGSRRGGGRGRPTARRCSTSGSSRRS